jgi:hypothetical protein
MVNAPQPVESRGTTTFGAVPHGRTAVVPAVSCQGT